MNESDRRSNVHYSSSNENKAGKRKRKFKPVQDSNPGPLRYHCSAPQTELTSQLGADYYVGSKKTREVTNKRRRIYESRIFELRIKT